MPVPTALPSSSRRVARALALHCRECGGGRLFKTWLRLQPRCATCGLKLDRGRPDHFVGAYLVNLIIAELLFAAITGIWVLLVWPDEAVGPLTAAAAVAVAVAVRGRESRSPRLRTPPRLAAAGRVALR